MQEVWPLTDEEIFEKFKSMASKRMSDERMEQLIEALFELDELDDVGKLNELMVFDKG